MNKKILRQTQQFTYDLVKLEDVEVFGVLKLMGIIIGEDEDFYDVLLRAQAKFKKMNKRQRRNLLELVGAAAEKEDEGNGESI